MVVLLVPQRRADELPGVGAAVLDRAASRRRARSGRTLLGRWGYTYPNPLRADGRAVAAVPGRQLAAELHDPRWPLDVGADARPRARGPACVPARAPAPAVREVRAATATRDPRGLHRRQLRRVPQLDLLRLVRPRARFYDAAGKRIARHAAALRPVREARSRPRSTPATSSGRSTSPPARSARSSSTCGGGRGPSSAWARYDGTKWLNFKITEYASPPRSPGAVGGASARSREPGRSCTSRGSRRAGRDMTSRSGRPAGRRR